MTTEERIKILKEMRLENLRNAAMYQRLSVSEEHWHTPRKEAYRDSAISCKKRSTALWWAIKLMEADNQIKQNPFGG